MKHPDAAERARQMARAAALLALAALAACGPKRREGPDLPYEEPDPIRVDLFQHERPMYNVDDPSGKKSYFVYSFEHAGRFVMTLEWGQGRRHATPEEARYALERYEAFHQLPAEQQDAQPLAGYRARKADAGNLDAELLARMDRTIARWQEEKRGLEAKEEAARVAGVPKESEHLGALIADCDYKIAVHEERKRLYLSPEWKAGRHSPVPSPTLRPADGGP